MKIQKTRIDDAIKSYANLTSDHQNFYRFGQHLFNELFLQKSNDRDKVHFDRIYEIEDEESVMWYMRKYDLIDYNN